MSCDLTLLASPTKRGTLCEGANSQLYERPVTVRLTATGEARTDRPAEVKTQNRCSENSNLPQTMLERKARI